MQIGKMSQERDEHVAFAFLFAYGLQVNKVVIHWMLIVTTGHHGCVFTQCQIQANKFGTLIKYVIHLKWSTHLIVVHDLQVGEIGKCRKEVMKSCLRSIH